MKSVVLKVSDFIKEHDNIFSIILIFLSIYGVTLYVPIINSDELWNFQNVYKLYNGFQIYTDANVIITPLFFWIGKLIFNIFGANFLAFRIYGILISVAFYFITYLLIKELRIRKKIAIIITMFLISFKGYYIILGQANYNTMALLFCMLGVLLYIRKYKYNNFLQGTILFLVFATKQNIGVFYAIGLFIYGILRNGKIKEKIKNLIIQFSIFSILILVMLIYFYKNNILYDFLNIAFFGIKEFAKENISINIINTIIITFLIFINLFLTIVYIKNKKVNETEKEKLLILECFSFPLILIVVPIVNDMHFLMGIYLSSILFIYQLYIMIMQIGFKISKKIINIVFIAQTIFMITYSTYYFIEWAITINSKDYNINKQNPFYGGLIDESTKKSIDNVVKYIESNSNNVIVLSSKAAFYMIQTNRSNGIMDLPNKGNLGKEGEEGLIEKIKNLYNTEILIEKNEEDLMWQESKMVREYILNNMQKIGEIEEFYIYK